MDKITSFGVFRHEILSCNGNVPKIIDYFTNLDRISIDMGYFAIKHCPQIIRYIESPLEELCLYAVQQDSDALGYIDDEFQTPAVCLAAVEKDGMALQHVAKQTPEICIAAVRNNGFALSLVENPTPAIIDAALEQNPKAVRLLNEAFLVSAVRHSCQLRTIEELICEAQGKRIPDDTLLQKQEETLSI